MWMHAKIEQQSGVWSRWLRCEGEPPKVICFDFGTRVVLQDYLYILSETGATPSDYHLDARYGVMIAPPVEIFDQMLLARGFQREKAPEQRQLAPPEGPDEVHG